MKTRLLYFVLLLATVHFSGRAQGSPWIRSYFDDLYVVGQMGSIPSGQLFAIALVSGVGGAKLYTSTDNGFMWLPVTNDTLITNQDPSGLLIDSTGVIYLSFSNAGVLRSTTGGASWTLVSSVTRVGRLFFYPKNRSLMAEVGPNVMFSSDSGATWQLTGSSHPHLFADPLGNLFCVDNYELLKSTDQGAHWYQPNTDILAATLKSLTSDDSGILYAATSGGGAYRSTNSGDSWSSINNGLLGTDVRSIVTSPSGAVFAASYGEGVFRSFDHGDSWTAINSGLSTTSVRFLFFMPNGTLYVAAEGTLFRTFQPLTTVSETLPYPSVISLHQNYPNPFNPATQISFDTDHFGSASITIRDVLGRQTLRFLYADLAPGRHQQTIDGTDLPSGSYFYTLEFVSRDQLESHASATRMMTLIR